MRRWRYSRLAHWLNVGARCAEKECNARLWSPQQEAYHVAIHFMEGRERFIQDARALLAAQGKKPIVSPRHDNWC